MRIETVNLSGFRCFGPDPITVAISPEITAVVGPNAAGKTALLHALSKLFGVSRAQRTVQRSDFHLGADDDPEDRDPKDLFINVLIGLPELTDGTATPETIAPSFRHMLIERDEDAPVCRLRLVARWEDDGTVEGEVSQELFWRRPCRCWMRPLPDVVGVGELKSKNERQPHAPLQCRPEMPGQIKAHRPALPIARCDRLSRLPNARRQGWGT
jgi:hypothetical protein